MTFRHSLAFGLLAATLALASPKTADATLIGDSIDLHVIEVGGGVLGPLTETVGAGVEYNLFDQVTIDVGASVIDFEVIDAATGSFVGNFDFVFSDLDWIDGNSIIAGVALTAFQGIGSVAFTADSVTFSVLNGDPITNGALASIELMTRQVDVPEPASLALFASSLGAFYFQQRRRRKA